MLTTAMVFSKKNKRKDNIKESETVQNIYIEEIINSSIINKPKGKIKDKIRNSIDKHRDVKRKYLAAVQEEQRRLEKLEEAKQSFKTKKNNKAEEKLQKAERKYLDAQENLKRCYQANKESTLAFKTNKTKRTHRIR